MAGLVQCIHTNLLVLEKTYHKYIKKQMQSIGINLAKIKN